MATTLLESAKQEHEIYKALKPKAGAALAAAEATVSNAQTQLTTATKEFARHQQEVEALRKNLAAVPLPADGQALLVELEQHIIDMRAKQAEILDAEDSLAAGDAKVKRARAELARATDRLADADKALTDAIERDKRLTAWGEAIKQAPLATLPGEADAAIRTPPKNDLFTTGKARVEDDIPKELRDRAHERGAQQRRRLTSTRDAVASAEAKRLAEQNAAIGVADQELGKARRELEAAEVAFRSYVTGARERYELARGFLSRIVTALPLTPAEKDSIVDAALVARGKAAAAIEKARDAALATVEAKRVAVEEAILTALAKAPADDPEQDTAVKAARAELTDAEEKLSEATQGLAVSAKEKARDDALEEKAKKQKAVDDAVAASLEPNPDDDPLVKAAKDELKKADEALASATTAFETADQARTDTRDALTQKKNALDAAIAAAKAKVPPVNPDSDPAVRAARTAVALAKNAAAKAERALAPISADLDAWEAAVPDASWRMLVDVEEAERLLTDLARVKPDDLLKAVKDKETALVAQLEASARSARTRAVLEDAVAERTARLAHATNAAAARLLSAIRGDR